MKKQLGISEQSKLSRLKDTNAIVTLVLIKVSLQLEDAWACVVALVSSSSAILCGAL